MNNFKKTFIVNLTDSDNVVYETKLVLILTSYIESDKKELILSTNDISAKTSIGPIINKFDNKEDLTNYKS